MASSPRASAWSGPLISACTLLALTGLCELGANAWIARRGDPLDHALRVIRADAALGWRQRSNLELVFYGARLRTNESGYRAAPLQAFARRGGLKVLVLGPSSAFGWGVREEETYAARLESMLAEASRARGAAVFNAGQIGYSSWQGLALYRGELRPMRPDVVVIAYGVNDADTRRFFFDSPDPDRIELAKRRDGWTVGAQNALGRLACFRWAVRRMRGAAGGASESHDASRSWRVAPGELRENVGEMIRIAREDGGRAILLTTPMNQDAFARAQGAEPRRLSRDLLEVNAAIKQAARELSVDLCDAHARLDGQTDAFVDPIHPSAAGHAAIARDLAALILSETPAE
jgi:lysophospholipase L1-like esterase